MAAAGRRRSWLVAGAIAGPALVVSAGGLFLQTRSDAKGGGVRGADTATGPRDAARAPDFAVATTAGATFRLSEQQGKAVVLFFTGPG